MKISILQQNLAICRLDPGDPYEWADSAEFISVTRTAEELSIVADQRCVPESVRSEKNWRALQLEGPLDLSLVGITAAIATPLAQAQINLFALSTFDTDYILVKADQLEQAVQTLRESGYEFLEREND